MLRQVVRMAYPKLERVAAGANALLGQAGLKIMRYRSLYPWQIAPARGDSVASTEVPSGAAEHLRFDNPALVDLLDRYRRFDPQVTAAKDWTESKISSSHLLYFRGDNPYVWQLRGPNFNELTYTVTYYALKSGRARDLLSIFTEDGLFGVHTFTIDGRSISRDLLDSVTEIDFIRRHLGLDGKSVLDIGAGYGRLAHRLTSASESIRVFATDAYAPSTFISEYYLNIRKAKNARTVPLDEVEELLRNEKIDLATNIHSFSECTADAVGWWAKRLADAQVPRLMLIPNARVFYLAELARDRAGAEIEATLAQYGYRPAVRELRFDDPVIQRYGVDPAPITLFELQ